MTKNNKELAEIFYNMAMMYRYIGNERFRALAYSKAAKAIESLPEDITIHIKRGKIEDIPGIGEHSSDKIEEYLETGKVSKYEELKKRVPFELLGVMEIRGFGPQTIKQLHDALHINNREELVEALQNGSISKIKGFGSKKVENMKDGLKLHKTVEERMFLWDALQASEGVIERLRKVPGVLQVEIAGSLRRKKETIGDIDILVSCKENDREQVLKYFTGPALAERILAKGDTKASIIHKETGRQIDLRMVNENEWGAALQYFTGSKEHNVHLRTIAKGKGFKINEYGIFNNSDNKRIAGKKEEDIYKVLGLKIMPPEMREDRGEIELAGKSYPPELITLKDIKGDLHLHSNWSDGAKTMEEIARYIMKNKPYEYMVISDHSKSTRIANGLNEKDILRQINEIDKLNKKLGTLFVKKGMEVDILANGKLDMPDDILSQLDWVTASIHSDFKKDNTMRIIRACENSYVSSIGHPTGRLIGSREAYKLDFPEIIKAAIKTGTALEINSQPQRMDLNDEMVFEARRNGVKFVINTDSHDLPQFDYMKLGVYIAMRGWCTKDDILNSKSWKELEDFNRHKRSKK